MFPFLFRLVRFVFAEAEKQSTLEHEIFKRETSETVGAPTNNIVCNLVPQSSTLAMIATDRADDNEVITDDVESKSRRRSRNTVVDGKYRECFEYKEFGSGLIKVAFNKSILSLVNDGDDGLSRQGRSSRIAQDTFEVKYRAHADVLGQQVALGHVEIGRNQNKSRLNINLFGSEYVDLNLCDVRNRDFFHANLVPLFKENIWFMTDVGIKIRYHLLFHFDVPESLCKDKLNDAKRSAEENTEILANLAENQMQLSQNTKIELGGIFDASFLVSQCIV